MGRERGGWGERECKKRKKKRKMNEKKWVAVGLVTVITEERRVVGGWVEKKALPFLPPSNSAFTPWVQSLQVVSALYWNHRTQKTTDFSLWRGGWKRGIGGELGLRLRIGGFEGGGHLCLLPPPKAATIFIKVWKFILHTLDFGRPG